MFSHYTPHTLIFLSLLIGVGVYHAWAWLAG